MSSAVGEVRSILASVVGDDIVSSLHDDDPIFGHGVVDSLHLVEIIDRLEGGLGIEVGGEDLSPQNFGSIAGMAAFLERKRAGTALNPTDQ